VEIDPATGDVAGLTVPDGARLTGHNGRLLAFRHFSFDAADVDRHMDSYLVSRPEWAILDHSKPGLAEACTARSMTLSPIFAEVSSSEEGLVIRATMPSGSVEALGAPDTVEWRLAPGTDGLCVTLVLRGKRANRMPEAGMLEITPEGTSGWRLLKSGLWIDPSQTARRGGGALHAIFAARAHLGERCLHLVPLDTALAGAVGRDFMHFDPEPPDYREGLRLNLYNNKWGTNFPMWWEGDLLSRLTLQV
jgi:hypothetical protein